MLFSHRDAPGVLQCVEQAGAVLKLKGLTVDFPLAERRAVLRRDKDKQGAVDRAGWAIEADLLDVPPRNQPTSGQAPKAHARAIDRTPPHVPAQAPIEA